MSADVVVVVFVVFFFQAEDGIRDSPVTGVQTCALPILANYQTALRAVTYQNTDTDNPTTSTRTVTFTINDGTADSNTQTRAISINAVNDTPVLAGVEGSTLAYTEGDAASPISASVTVADVDDTQIESATVQITSRSEERSVGEACRSRWSQLH